MKNFHDISSEIWNDYKNWDENNKEVVSIFIDFLDIEINRLIKRKEKIEIQKKTDFLLSKIIDIDLVYKSRELNFLYSDMEYFFDYLYLREIGSLNYSTIPFITIIKDFLKNGFKEKASKENINIKSYFRFFSKIINSVLLDKPIIKLDYNLIKYFIENDNSIDWIRNFIKNWISKIDKTLFIEDSFIDEILNFFKIEFKRLLDVLPKESNQGFGKMLKVLLGVFIYSIDNIVDLSYEESKDIIFKYIKIGYYWGISYPLIDDVLDSDILDKNQVENFTNKLFLSIKGDNIKDIGNLPSFCYLLFEYINKMSFIIDQDNLEKLIEILNLAHISQIKKFNLDINFNDFYINIMLKATLIRIATMKLANKKEISDELIYNCFLVSIHNQLEDDFKDFFEDKNKSIKTSFILFTEGKIKENPIITFIKYNMFIASKFEKKEKIIKLFGIQFCEIIKYIKDKYGYEKLLEFIELFKNNKLKEKMLEINNYTDCIYYINSEIYLMDYFEENVKKYQKTHNTTHMNNHAQE